MRRDHESLMGSPCLLDCLYSRDNLLNYRTTRVIYYAQGQQILLIAAV